MWRKVPALALAWALVFAQAGAAQQAGGTDARAVEKVKVALNRAGTGEGARVRVRLKDGTSRKGFVSERREREFVLRDRKTGAPSIIAYEDVSKIERGYGNSPVHNFLLATGIGLGSALLLWGILIGASDD